MFLGEVSVSLLMGNSLLVGAWPASKTNLSSAPCFPPSSPFFSVVLNLPSTICIVSGIPSEAGLSKTKISYLSTCHRWHST